MDWTLDLDQDLDLDTGPDLELDNFSFTKKFIQKAQFSIRSINNKHIYHLFGLSSLILMKITQILTFNPIFTPLLLHQTRIGEIVSCLHLS